MSAIETLLKASEAKRNIEDIEAKMERISRELMELNGRHSATKRELRLLSEQAFKEWEQENA